MEGEWYSGGLGIWWLMGGESAGLPAAALGLQRWEGVLTNCSECSRFSRMDQEMVSSLEQTSQESAPSRKDQVPGIAPSKSKQSTSYGLFNARMCAWI